MDFTYLWLLASTLMLMHQYQASTLPATTTDDGHLAPLVHQPHRREKRCSCENQKDKECIFFCHIGIVWVNTPSHVVPYGFGPVRLRRELGRCACADSLDAKCVSFCSDHTLTREDNTGVKRKSAALLLRYRAALWEKRRRHALQQQT